MAKKSSKKRDMNGTHDSDIGTTYFSYAGPSSLDAATTTNINSKNNDDILGRIDSALPPADSIHTSPSEIGDVMALPMRPHPHRGDPRNILFLAPPYSCYDFPAHPNLGHPMRPIAPYEMFGRTPSDDSLFAKRSENPYPHLQTLTLREVVIFVGAMFLLALVAVIFTAVYFGHNTTPKSEA